MAEICFSPVEPANQTHYFDKYMIDSSIGVLAGFHYKSDKGEANKTWSVLTV